MCVYVSREKEGKKTVLLPSSFMPFQCRFGSYDMGSVFFRSLNNNYTIIQSHAELYHTAYKVNTVHDCIPKILVRCIDGK